MESLIFFFSTYGYLAVFGVLLACGFGLPIPEDVTLVSGGVISGLGYANVHTMLLVSMLGVLAGDSIMYWLGRVYGEKILQFPFIRKIVTAERFAYVKEQFAKNGNRVLFTARFLPGLRAAIYLVSGITKQVSFTRFLLVDFSAAIISVPIWVYLGDYGASNIEWLHKQIKHGQHIIFGAIALLAIYLGLKWYRSYKAKQAKKNS